jgi:hypothetical protein
MLKKSGRRNRLFNYLKPDNQKEASLDAVRVEGFFSKDAIGEERYLFHTPETRKGLDL